jgi:hypothetical protein
MMVVVVVVFLYEKEKQDTCTSKINQALKKEATSCHMQSMPMVQNPVKYVPTVFEKGETEPPKKS